jgi:hypothetical protein
MEKIIVDTKKKKINHEKNYKNKIGLDIQVRYTRTWLQKGKSIAIYQKDEQKTKFTVKKEDKTLVIVKEQEILDGEKEILERETTRLSERTGYKELWSIFDNCYYYEYLED